MPRDVHEAKPVPSTSPSNSDEAEVHLEMVSLLDGTCIRRRSTQPRCPMLHACLAAMGLAKPLQRERTITISEQWIMANRSAYPQNAVKNTKYNIITFLPKTLFEQFRYFYNLYFLIVSLSQIVPALQV